MIDIKASTTDAKSNWIVNSYIENNLLEILKVNAVLSILLQSFTNEERDLVFSHVIALALESLDRAIEGNNEALSYLNMEHNTPSINLVVHCAPLKTIGERIFSCRKDQGVSRKFIAKQINVKPHAIYLWETNKGHPTSDKLIPLATALSCEPSWLLTGN